ncbi:MAG: glycosyltransferase family 2 protein [Ignavibacteriaceae bacterium]|nr:glycosyltransferase family 2 protein [Ignavibacteriaceae bacterium]
MNDFPIVTVITPNWNTPGLIIAYLESVKKQDYPPNKVEIIIVDNGSSDDSKIKIKEWFEANNFFYRNELISFGRNYGIAAAYNSGYENSSDQSEIIIRTESDVELEKDCIRNLIRTLQSDSEIGVAGARGTFFSDHSKTDLPARYINWNTGVMNSKDPSVLTECDCIFGGTFAVKKDLLKKMGYFFKSDRFFASELEFCTRVKLKYKKVVCQPSAVSYHKVGNTTGKMNKKKFSFIDSRELILFHLQYNKFPSKLFALSYFFLGVCKRFITGNVYPIWGFFSGLFSFIFKKDVLMPVDNKLRLISDWMSEKS